MNKCRAFDIKSLVFHILFSWFKLPLIKSGSWNKGVGSRFNFLSLCWSIRFHLEVCIFALVMRLIGYRSILELVYRCPYSCSNGLWKWLTKWMMVWNGYWSSPVISLLDAITGMGSEVVACDLVSKSYNLYAKLRKERSWKSGLTVWFSNWKMYTIWLGFHAGDRCWRCCGRYEQAGSKYRVEVNRSFRVEISLSLRFSCISQVDDTNLMLIDDNLLIFWTGFYCYEYNFSSLNGFGAIIIYFFLMAWGTGGVGDLDLDFCGSQVLIKQVPDETCCMSYSLLNWFGQNVYYGSTNALFFCIFQHKIHQMITQRKNGDICGI